MFEMAGECDLTDASVIDGIPEVIHLDVKSPAIARIEDLSLPKKA
jgi:hypothetical protein